MVAAGGEGGGDLSPPSSSSSSSDSPQGMVGLQGPRRVLGQAAPLKLVAPKSGVPPAWTIEFQNYLTDITRGNLRGRLDLFETSAKSAASAYDVIAESEKSWSVYEQTVASAPPNVPPPPPPPPKRGSASWCDLMLLTDAYLSVAANKGWLAPIANVNEETPTWWTRLPRPIREKCIQGPEGDIVAAPYRLTHVAILTKPSSVKRLLGDDAPDSVDMNTLLDPRMKRRVILPAAPAIWRDIAQRAMAGRAGDPSKPLRETTRVERAVLTTAIGALRANSLVAPYPKVDKADGKKGADTAARAAMAKYDAELARSLLSGDAVAAVLDASTAVALSRRYPGLQVEPASESLGSLLCMDAWVRPRCARSRLGDLTEPWLDFLSEPQRCTAAGRFRGSAAAQKEFATALSPYAVGWGTRSPPGGVDKTELWVPTAAALEKSCLAPANTAEDAEAWREVLQV